MSVTEILSEVQDRAASLNGEAVLGLFRWQPFECDDCVWSENTIDFQRIIKEYTRAKIMYHRSRKSGYYDEWYGEKPRTDENYWLRQVFMYQEMLAPIRPCLKCIHRFNPTGRDKLPEPSLPSLEPPLENSYV